MRHGRVKLLPVSQSTRFTIHCMPLCVDHYVLIIWSALDCVAHVCASEGWRAGCLVPATAFPSLLRFPRSSLRFVPERVADASMEGEHIVQWGYWCVHTREIKCSSTDLLLRWRVSLILQTEDSQCKRGTMVLDDIRTKWVRILQPESFYFSVF